MKLVILEQWHCATRSLKRINLIRCGLTIIQSLLNVQLKSGKRLHQDCACLTHELTSGEDLIPKHIRTKIREMQKRNGLLKKEKTRVARNIIESQWEFVIDALWLFLLNFLLKY